MHEGQILEHGRWHTEELFDVHLAHALEGTGRVNEHFLVSKHPQARIGGQAGTSHPDVTECNRVLQCLRARADGQEPEESGVIRHVGSIKRDKCKCESFAYIMTFSP